MHLVLFGTSDQLLAGVTVEIDGQSAQTAQDGSVTATPTPGTHKLRLRVPHALVPEAPTQDAEWVVDVSDVAVLANQTTEVMVTLSPSGGIAGLDIQAPEAAGGSHSLQREFQEKVAEQPAGTIQGTVTAKEDGSPVAGARVYVRGAPVETATDDNGFFTLTMPAGKCQLAVVHPSYATQSVPDVEVRGGKVNAVTAQLSPASMEIDEFLVTAPHIEGGIASLISERRESSNVADVIGAEQMSRSGATNAASALSRVTGLTVVDGKFVVVRGMGERYSSMLVNNMFVPSPEPTRRVVPLDLFPAGILDSVVVQKTFSPDAPAEFGGGVIQLRTRSYPDRFMANVSVGGGVNSQSTFRNNLNYSGGKRDYLGIDDGNRALPGPIDHSKKITKFNALTGGYTDEERAKYGKMLRNDLQEKRERTLPDLTLTGSIGNRWNLRHAKIGFVAALGYRSQTRALRDSLLRSVTNTGSKLQIDNDLRVNNTERQISTSGFLDWGVEFSERNKLKFTSMLLRQTDDTTTQLSGKFGTGGGSTTPDSVQTRLGWIERQLFDQQISGKHIIPKLNDFQLDWRYSFAQANRNEPDRRDYFYSDNGSGSFELSQAAGDYERQWGTLTDRTYQVGLDLTQPINIWSQLKAKAKVGGLVYWRNRDSHVRRFEFQGGLDPMTLAKPINQIYTPQRIDSGAVNLIETTFAQDSYTAKMQLNAAYAMLELPLLKNLDIMGGARVEQAIISVTSFDQFNPLAGAEKAELSKTPDVLPAITATWRFAEDFQLRAGYGKTVNRPDLRELSTSSYYDIETASTFAGVPTLKRALIDNVDGRLEYYFSSDEVFSVGAFYKRFKDPIETVFRNSADVLYTLQNSDKARLFGLEIEGRKRLGFLAEALDTLFIAGNFSWIDSEVTYTPDGLKKTSRPLQSQSPWVVNAQLGYDDDVEGGSGTAVSLLYNISGPRLRAIGNAMAGIPDQYEQPFHQLDLVASQRLPHNLQLGLRGQNLLNATQRWTQGHITTREFKRGVYIVANLAWSY
ncbi:MAG: TonB-dependent receptor [Myxococcales bacterium]